jgi:hypothetical protein
MVEATLLLYARINTFGVAVTLRGASAGYLKRSPSELTAAALRRFGLPYWVRFARPFWVFDRLDAICGGIVSSGTCRAVVGSALGLPGSLKPGPAVQLGILRLRR